MKSMVKLAGICAALFVYSTVASAATGEYWEVTTKMEMEGMPFAMPAQTVKICLPKGGQSDPTRTQGKDSNCTMSEVKHSGNTVRFKGSCVNQGETMNMSGETSHDDNSFKSNVKMSGKARGESMNMSLASTGKRVGGACDPDEQRRKAEAMGRAAKVQADANLARACDTSGYTATRWVGSAGMFIGSKPTCPGKQEELCKVVRTDVAHDAEAFLAMQRNEGIKGQPSLVKTCNVNLDEMKKSLCREKARSGPLQFLDANCPVEAKAYRELLRKREECAGRGYTSGLKMKQCMGGEVIEEDAQTEKRPARSRKSSAAAEVEQQATDDASSEAVKQGTKALKNLFGF